MVAQKRICLQCKKPGFCPSAEKIPWRREWLPTPVFLPREFHEQRGVVGYSPWGHKESDTTERLILLHFHPKTWGFPGGSVIKKSACQCRRCKWHGFSSRVWKIHWKRKWQPIPVFLPGKFYGERSLAGYSPWGCKESDMTEHGTIQNYKYFIQCRHTTLILPGFTSQINSYYIFYKICQQEN